MLISETSKHISTANVISYAAFVSGENRNYKNDLVSEQRQASVRPGDVLNLQFTSGKSQTFERLTFLILLKEQLGHLKQLCLAMRKSIKKLQNRYTDSVPQ